MGADDLKPSLDATGERLVPELQHGELVHAEHLARYRLATQLARSRRVLDVACGTGYGTAMLASLASEAIGADLDAETVAYAHSRHPGCEFAVADIRRLPFDDGAFDLVVSFETIEHVAEHERALAELRRVLAGDGVLLISSPNKREYLVENEFHQRELTHEEFVGLLESVFPAVEVLLQHNWVTSAILDLPAAADDSGDREHELDFFKVGSVTPGRELYTLALCGGERALGPLRGVGVAAAVDESHRLVRRLESAERTAERWHGEYQEAERLARERTEAYELAQARLEDAYASLSWRVTRPLRAAKRFLGRKG